MNSWAEFLDTIIHFTAPEQPEDLQTSSFASVGRFLLHDLDACVQVGICEQLLLLLVNTHSCQESTGMLGSFNLCITPA